MRAKLLLVHGSTILLSAHISAWLPEITKNQFTIWARHFRRIWDLGTRGFNEGNNLILLCLSLFGQFLESYFEKKRSRPFFSKIDKADMDSPRKEFLVQLYQKQVFMSWPQTPRRHMQPGWGQEAPCLWTLITWCHRQSMGHPGPVGCHLFLPRWSQIWWGISGLWSPVMSPSETVYANFWAGSTNRFSAFAFRTKSLLEGTAVLPISYTLGYRWYVAIIT